MLKRLFVAVALLLGLLLAAEARANPLTFKADPESASRGVGSYLVERSVNAFTVTVLDPKGVELQVISATLGLPEGARLEIKAGNADLLVTLNLEARHLSVTDNTTGESAAATFRNGQPLLIEGSRSFLEDRSQVVGLAAVAYEQTLINLGLRATAPVQPSPVPQCSAHSRNLLLGQPSAAPLFPAAGSSAQPKEDPTCNGVFEVGIGVGTTLAIACANAQQHANNMCTNGYCYGCCQLLIVPNTKSPCGCDCLFNNGTLCDCNVTGQACADDGSDGGGVGGGGSAGGGGGGGGGNCRTSSGSCDASCFSCIPAI